jgi:ribosomal protein L32
MTDETSQAIVGDSVVSAMDGSPGGRKRRFWRRKPKKELAPLTHCENCGTELRGHYCSNCGQAAIDYRRSFRHVIIDVLDSFLNWDSKFVRTIGLLLWRPGWLTNQFVDGRRVRFLHPLRLYLLVSIVFFLCAKLIPVNDSQTVKAEDLPPEARARYEEKMAKVKALRKDGGLFTFTTDEKEAGSPPPPATPAEPKSPTDSKQPAIPEAPAPSAEASNEADTPQPSVAATASPAGTDELIDEIKHEVTTGKKKKAPDKKGDLHIKFGPEKEGPKTPFEAWMQQRIKDRIGEDGTKAKLFVETLRSNLSTMMLFCVPVFAFILKILYIRQKRFYIEHLVYALNIHAFFYISAILVVLISIGLNMWIPGALQVLATIFLGLLVVVQIFVSIRRVYRQSWFMTAFKFCLGGFIYLFVIAFAVGATAVLTLVLP